jgi:hypothetical protein
LHRQLSHAKRPQQYQSGFGANEQIPPQPQPKEHTDKRFWLLIFSIDIPTYLKFHKNACNNLEEKRVRKLRQKMMLKKEAKKVSQFSTEMGELSHKKMRIQVFTSSSDPCTVCCDQHSCPWKCWGDRHWLP